MIDPHRVARSIHAIVVGVRLRCPGSHVLLPERLRAVHALAVAPDMLRGRVRNAREIGVRIDRVQGDAGLDAHGLGNFHVHEDIEDGACVYARGDPLQLALKFVPDRLAQPLGIGRVHEVAKGGSELGVTVGVVRQSEHSYTAPVYQ